MAHTTQVLSRSPYLSGGFTTAGTAKNDKELVVALVTISSYTASGEVFQPHELGLNTFDFIGFDIVSVQDAATVPAAASLSGAGYDRTGERIVINNDLQDNSPVTTGQAAVLRVLAFGDSSRAPALT